MRLSLIQEIDHDKEAKITIIVQKVHVGFSSWGKLENENAIMNNKEVEKIFSERKNEMI